MIAQFLINHKPNLKLKAFQTSKTDFKTNFAIVRFNYYYFNQNPKIECLSKLLPVPQLPYSNLKKNDNCCKERKKKVKNRSNVTH